MRRRGGRFGVRGLVVREIVVIFYWLERGRFAEEAEVMDRRRDWKERFYG